MKLLLGLGALTLLLAVARTQETTDVQENPFGHWIFSKGKSMTDRNTVIVRTQPFTDDGMVNNVKFYGKSKQTTFFLILDKKADGDFTIAYKTSMRSLSSKRTTMTVMADVKAGQYWAFGWARSPGFVYKVPTDAYYEANGPGYGYAVITDSEPEVGDAINGFKFDKEGGNRGYAVWITYQKDNDRAIPHGPWGIQAMRMGKSAAAADRTWIRLYPFDRSGTVLLAETMGESSQGVTFILYERLPGPVFKVVYKHTFKTKAYSASTTQLMLRVEAGQYWGFGWDRNAKMYKSDQADDFAKTDGSNYAYVLNGPASMPIGDIVDDFISDIYAEMKWSFRLIFRRDLALQPYALGSEAKSRSSTENAAKMIIIRSQTFTDRLNLGRYDTLSTYTTKSGEMTFYIFNKVGMNNFEVVYSKTFAVNKGSTSTPMTTQLAEGQAWGVGWTSSIGLKFQSAEETDWYKYGPLYWYTLDSNQVSVGGFVNDTVLSKSGSRYYSVELGFYSKY